jgi:ribonuclease-3
VVSLRRWPQASQPPSIELSDSLDLAPVEAAIGYQFGDSRLLAVALTHSSFASENDVESYERLEFLGDAVLELATTQRIFELLGDATEGQMTRLRAAVVDEATLAAVAREHDLPESIRLGVGEARNGGRDRQSIQSDVVEAILGAVYIDGGAEAAFGVVLHLLGDALSARLAAPNISDARSILQELLARDSSTVVFEYERSGPDHAVVYTATATVDEKAVGTGTGPSKKSAAIDAARNALHKRP